MPSSAQRRSPSAPGPRARAAPARPRTRRPIGRGFATPAVAPLRPVQAPFAAVFGVLTAVVDGYLGTVLVTDPELGWGWYLLPFAVLALLALAGAALVWAGRARGAAVLAVAGLLTALGLVALLVLFLVLGGGTAAWWVLFLLVAPVGALALALRAPVRRWTRPGPRTVPGTRRGG